ncbi:hemerythrin domain-containing protein [Dactylosporangium roseum]|uniref:Hemerythrin domain-containing protein n=1 Tax=Dactylosporangium roseum TaxID=47989 RepID=A0ABY5YXR5_9ACTN|nr:hemerythrin domain-containing protein [Dactylosporangium roseum]UWZ34171.1 hemerythrin domain-containing protein [Dactylosporangium roseum]
MCEYCGCNALDAIADLTREHDLVVNLTGDVRAAHAAGDVARMSELARRIAAILGPHTQVEEHGLFPALAGDFPDHVTALAAEHRVVEAVLGEASGGTPPDRDWPGRLLDALEVLREHILKEQDGVFPAALATLRPDDWDAVDAVRARVGTLLPVPGA